MTCCLGPLYRKRPHSHSSVLCLVANTGHEHLAQHTETAANEVLIRPSAQARPWPALPLAVWDTAGLSIIDLFSVSGKFY